MSAPSPTAAPSPPRRPFNWPLLGAWIALTLLLLTIAITVLRGCGIAWPDGRPIVSFCTVPLIETTAPRLATEQERTAVLLQRRAQLRQQALLLPPCPSTERAPG